MIHKIKYLLVLIAMLGSFNLSEGQELAVPIDIQLDILPKILTFNKSFNLDDPNTTINVGILYSSKVRSSVKVKDDIFNQLPESLIKIKKAIAFIIPIDLANIKDIEEFLKTTNINVLYFSPLRGYDISKISRFCKKSNILSFTGVSSFLEENDISVGFELQNNKLQITINLESAKAEGANFSSRLLSLSKIKK